MAASRATEFEWHNLKAHELNALAKRDAVVIVPVGSTEQHGPHLPVQVDALLAAEVTRRAARKLCDRGKPVVILPAVWTGLAEHHMAFGGTITLDFATFHALLRGICQSVVRHGFRRVLLMNGHGGNIAALNVIVGELARELGVSIATTSYWTLDDTAKSYAKILERQTNVRHACEAETSMLLLLRPDLVDTKAMRAIADPPMEVMTSHKGMYRYRSFREFSESGVIGDPSVATARKGERLLEAAALALADAIEAPGFWASERGADRRVGDRRRRGR